MAVTAALVKELRERTGAGMMECKKALTENGGDIEATIEAMRKSGQAKAAKKAGRIAADGVVVIRIADDGKRGVVLEVNSETDFVAKDAGFQAFADGAAAQALASDVAGCRRVGPAAHARDRRHRRSGPRGTHQQDRRERPVAPTGALSRVSRGASPATVTGCASAS